MIRWFKRKKKEGPAPPEEARQQVAGEEQPGQGQAVDATAEDGAAQVWEAPGTGPATELQPDAQTGPETPAGAEPEDEAYTQPESGAEAGAEPVGEIEPEAGNEPESDVEPEAEPEVRESRFFSRLRERLHKTRERFVHRVDRLVLGRKVIDQDLLDELEEVLITSDLGVHTTQLLLKKVADKVKRRELTDPEKLRDALREEISAILAVGAPPLDFRADRPFVVMVIGVNGVGKTTTIGKLAHQLSRENLRPMLVAADTFRAAAIEQLTIWGERTGAPVIKQKGGSDPSAVAFDAMDAAVSRDAGVVLLDTAGRMHTKVNLMEELKKVHRTVSRKIPAAPHEVLLVLDASTGQNALSQARLFKEQIGVTGLILTKLDGTAKGGIVVAICDELKVPVRYIGIGESVDDLRPFDAEEFANALF